jgi:hypothetical protein
MLESVVDNSLVALATVVAIVVLPFALTKEVYDFFSGKNGY